MPTPGSRRTTEWRKRNREKYNAQVRRMRERHREKHVERARRLKKKAKEKIAGRPMADACEVCGIETTMCLDHCHTTGAFRGWLCMNCNFALGHAKDSPELLKKLAVYLERADAFNS